MAENLSPKTEKISEVKESPQKSEEIFKENNTPQTAIEHTQNELPIENGQIQPGII